MNENKEFKPYVPAEKITPEFTVTSIIMGILLAIVFGAANAYLGLRVGMTVSASIPAAVISMGVIRVLMKKNSILESNMVQTIGSVMQAPGHAVLPEAKGPPQRFLKSPVIGLQNTLFPSLRWHSGHG